MNKSQFPGRPTTPIRSLIGGLAVVIALTGLGCGEDGGGSGTAPTTGPAAKNKPDPKSGGAVSDNKDLMGGIPRKDR